MARSADRNENDLLARDGGAFSRRSLLRGGTAVAAAGAFGAFLAACSSSSSTSAGSSGSAGSTGSASAAGSLGSLSLQLGWIPGAGYSGSFIADSKGYYSRQGVKVSILPRGP